MKLKLPPDPKGKNDDLAKWAGSALEVFRAETGSAQEDAVADLVADLAHWCDRNGMNLAEELESAQGYYRAETGNDGKQFEL